MIFSCLEEKKSLLNFYLEYIFLFQSLFPINFNSVRSSAGMNPMEFAPSEVRLA